MPAEHFELAQALLSLFDNDINACLRWLNSPLLVFGDITPLEKIREDGNTEAVVTVVNQIAHGIIM